MRLAGGKARDERPVELFDGKVGGRVEARPLGVGDARVQRQQDVGLADERRVRADRQPFGVLVRQHR